MYEQLEIFRKAHGIEHSTGDLMSNVNDEVTEVLREIFKNNVLRMVDEFSDIVIYIINGLEQLGHDAESNIVKAGRNAMAPGTPTPMQAVASIFMAESHYLLNKDVHALALIANIALSAIDTLGFHAKACVTEKAKCINSREGAHNAEAGKWQKNPNQDPSTLYKPQYNNCKK